MSATVTDFAEAVKNKITEAGRIESLSRGKSGNIFLTLSHDRAKNVQSHVVIRSHQIPQGLAVGATIQYHKAEGCLGYRKNAADKPLFYDFINKPRVIESSQVVLGLFVQHEYRPGHPYTNKAIS